MSRSKKIILFSSLAGMTVIAIILGLFFSKTEDEKINGLSEIFDVSVNDTIAYVSYNKGKPELYMKSDVDAEKILQLESNEVIWDITFSADGTTLIFVVSPKNAEESLESTVYALDVRSLDKKELFHADKLITEIKFDPKDEQRLFYLAAHTFENYSPIAAAYPHDMDVYSFHLSEKKETRETTLESYSMRSLQVSATEQVVYVQMNDDFQAETAEDIFATTQKIFQIPLDQPNDFKVISDENRDVDIYDFAIVPNEDAMIFQSVSNTNSTGTFEYELYYYDWKTKEEKRLTDLREYAGKPRIATNGDVYFIVDTQFAQSKPKHHLYKMTLNGENIEEIKLP